MKRLLVFVICFSCMFVSLGQETEQDTDQEIEIDSLYREDQFYVGVTYNLLLNKPRGISQSGFSGGLHLGFIRDMPINKRRNIAIGLGLGYSLNVYNQDLFIGEEEETERGVFSSLDDIDFSTNRFTTHLVEAPLEFRWRTSTPETHKFYRIYTGIRMGYLYSFQSRFKGAIGEVKQTKVEELNRWRIGATFTFGWNTFNFHFYYSINTLFNDDAVVNGESVGFNTAKIGLMFYIL
ncbi:MULTISPECIES: porin family protein [Aquimarina]|uniref:PorT family protein n=1 Tax=Aquimarina algiphila TaxID=2047982 RepID=A0A554VN10_9FLAO|nr:MULTISPECIES: porin family protein [Aquimarina]TSE09746.1 PorT family protein [Aquimarina algiphila]